MNVKQLLILLLLCVLCMGVAIPTLTHNSLDGLQGGQSGQYYHLTEANYTSISNWDTAYGWGDHSAQNYFDIDINSLGDITGAVLNVDTTNARVGIGTTSPQQLLHLSADNATMNEAIRLQNTGSSVGDEIGIYFRHYTDGRLQAFIKDELTSGWPTKLHFGTAAGVNNAATKMTIDGSGNVGIGTVSPGTLLHIAGSGTSVIRLSDTGASTDIQVNAITEYYRGINTNRVGWAGFGSSSNNDYTITNQIAGGDIILMPTATGKVGIGTATPATKLDINGVITATGLTLTGVLSMLAYDITADDINCDMIRANTAGEHRIVLDAAADTIHIKIGDSASDNYLILKSTSSGSDSPQLYPSSNLYGHLGYIDNRWGKLWVDDIDADGSITMDTGETVDGRDISADGATLDGKPDLGEISTTAYRGDRGKTAYDYSQVGHLPLAGGILTGDQVIAKANPGLWLQHDTVNETLSGHIDFTETSAAFGGASGWGFRIRLDGSANDFIIQSGNETTVNDRFSIDRDTGNIVIAGTLTVNGDQEEATDHVFDDYNDIELLEKWRRGKPLPFAVGDILNRDRLLRDSIIQLKVEFDTLKAEVEELKRRE